MYTYVYIQYMCIYTYMYICIYTHTYTYTHIHVDINLDDILGSMAFSAHIFELTGQASVHCYLCAHS